MDSDNDSYVSSDQGGEGGDDSEEDVAEFEPIPEDEDDEEGEEAQERAKKEARRARKKEKRRAIHNEIAELRGSVGGDNEPRNPVPGETLAEFYSRTMHYWNEEAAKSAGKLPADRGMPITTTKEVKREGFCLAKERHEEIERILGRLGELESLLLECDEKKARKKAEKKPKKDRLR